MGTVHTHDDVHDIKRYNLHFKSIALTVYKICPLLEACPKTLTKWKGA